jgi:hypothetical protein
MGHGVLTHWPFQLNIFCIKYAQFYVCFLTSIGIVVRWLPLLAVCLPGHILQVMRALGIAVAGAKSSAGLKSTVTIRVKF